MIRMSAIIAAALLAVSPLTVNAQERGPRPVNPDRDQPREQLRPSVSVGEAVQRASSGRPGRFLGASERGGTIVVRWEYPGGRIADIMVDGRSGRVIGER
ncbi:PepSY domain-containing protein [Brevundimonas lenta]|uniref:PepSY domain-containing protein n=1 Tax=Brevundimonas lenta TaxID=424796 RepID=A0A7W6JBL3_9CAUL|nr:hypothetical protein [Brevundimonas lenta]MBB4082121.1 hypothetical protein [Brevundimonas lenta]